MILLGIVAVSLLLAYRAMSVGLLPVLSRCLMGALSISTGVGLAGPLREAIPEDNAYLLGGCLIVITAGAYLLQRGLASFYMLERDVALPDFVDRLGAAICGFLGGLMSGGFICLVILAFPLPRQVADVEPELRRSASFAVDAAKMVGVVAGTDHPILLETILPLMRKGPDPGDPPQSAPSGRTGGSFTPSRGTGTSEATHRWPTRRALFES